MTAALWEGWALSVLPQEADRALSVLPQEACCCDVRSQSLGPVVIFRAPFWPAESWAPFFFFAPPPWTPQKICPSDPTQESWHLSPGYVGSGTTLRSCPPPCSDAPPPSGGGQLYRGQGTARLQHSPEEPDAPAWCLHSASSRKPASFSQSSSQIKA